MGYRLEVETESVFKGKEQEKTPFNCWCGGKLYGNLENKDIDILLYLFSKGISNKFRKRL